MVPPAPGRFSTISGWPLANCAKPFDRLRDSVSAAPPAPTVTSSRTGRSGHCAADWAKAGDGGERGKRKCGRPGDLAARKAGEWHGNPPGDRLLLLW